MAFLNGTEAAAERRAANDAEPLQSDPKPGVQSGPDDVTITIRGSMAARMLGRGDAEESILAELTGVSRRLDRMEAAAERRAADHEALRQTVQGLEERVAQLSGQVADQVTELRTELTRLRSDFDSHAVRAVLLPGQVERAQGQVDLLQRQVSPLAGELAQLQMRLGELEHRLGPPPPRPRSDVDAGAQTDGASDPKGVWGGILGRFEQWRQPGKASANGEASANGSWLKQRLNSLWLW
jgi:prefoldin subunit 5